MKKQLMYLLLGIILLFSSCQNHASKDIFDDNGKTVQTRLIPSRALDIVFTKEIESKRAIVTDANKISYFNLNMVGVETNEYDVSNLHFGKDESYYFVAKMDFSAFVSIDAFDEHNKLVAHGHQKKEFQKNHKPSESNVVIVLDEVFNNNTSDYVIIPVTHDPSNIKTDDKLDYYRINEDKTLITFDSQKGPYYQIDLINKAILSCTSSQAEIKYFLLTEEELVIDLYSAELPFIYEYVFDLTNQGCVSSVCENNYLFNATDYEGNKIPTECTHEILSGENYVTISTNGIPVAQVVLPTSEYGDCEILWTSIKGLYCEGQILFKNKYAISTYINGVWKQNKHENWETPAQDSSGANISGTGEGGCCDYNFRYSIETSLDSTEEYSTNGFLSGNFQDGSFIKMTTILRYDDLATTDCGIYDNFFQFDFNHGAMFQISFDGNILYTSECIPVGEYRDTFGVSIKNFSKTGTKIEFELLDGEYSETEYAHYGISL